MKVLILPKGILAVVFLVSAALFAVQWGIRKGIINHTTKQEQVSCEVHSFESANERVTMNLVCGDTEAHTKQPEVITSVFNNNGPVTCRVFKSGRAKCEPRKTPHVSSKTQ